MSNTIQHYFGIDFGTTHCATVGYTIMDERVEEILYGDDEGRPVPAMIAIDKKTGKIFAGREAWEKRLELAQTCEFITSIKTLMDTDWGVCIAGNNWSPEKVATEIFKSLKNIVQIRTGINLEEAVVAIPIGFSPLKRRRLRKAAIDAGIDIKSFISEPTAAFFANYEHVKGDENVVVFDWGGGTLDISVLRHIDGKLYEIATEGMNLAGDFIDQKIARRIHSKLSREKGINISYDDMPVSSQDLLIVRSERAKRQLSNGGIVTISINNYGKFEVVRETIDYEWFAEVINPEVESAIKCLDKAIEQSLIGIANIDRIIMVGGSSNLKPLTDKMTEIYGDKLYFPEETMWNVGQGAAMISRSPGNYYSNQEIGVITSDGKLFSLLKPHESINGWKASARFGIVDSSKEARFIFGGCLDLDNSDEKYCILEVPAYRFLEEQINLTATIDDDLIFAVTAASNMQPKNYSRFWHYDKLKFYYRLPSFSEKVKYDE